MPAKETDFHDIPAWDLAGPECEETNRLTHYCLADLRSTFKNWSRLVIITAVISEILLGAPFYNPRRLSTARGSVGRKTAEKSPQLQGRKFIHAYLLQTTIPSCAENASIVGQLGNFVLINIPRAENVIVMLRQAGAIRCGAHLSRKMAF